jgi:polyhydroxyalkanoate synthesis regulator phasin
MMTTATTTVVTERSRRRCRSQAPAQTQDLTQATANNSETDDHLEGIIESKIQMSSCLDTTTSFDEVLNSAEMDKEKDITIISTTVTTTLNEAAAIQQHLSTTYSHPQNCIKQYVEIRNQIAKRRETLMQTKVERKLPSNFQDFLIRKKSYLIRGNKEVRHSIPFYKPVHDLPEDLKEYYLKQEKERYSLRLRHRIEQDKLCILYEQELIRCYNQVFREEIHQLVPFSFCAIVRDEETYMPEQVVQPNTSSSLSVTTAKTSDEISSEIQLKFNSVLTNLKNKFQKLKDDLIKRQLNESDSLHAVQKMNYQSKIREISIKLKSMSAVNSMSGNGNSLLLSSSILSNPLLCQQVPIVHVNNKFFDSFDNPANFNCNSSSFSLCMFS